MSDQRLNGWNPQKTVYTYAKDREFGPGLRKGALYADLGLIEATRGQFHGEIIKKNPDYTPPQEEKNSTTGMHRHQYDFQFNYVLSGEIDLVIEDKQETTFRAGDTYFIPSRALHDETRVSKDFQVMQIYGPAKAQTETVGQAVGGGEVSDDWADKLSKMKEERLTGWNKQKPAFTFANSREFGSGLRKASLYADLGLAEATEGQFHGEIIKINNDVHTPQGTTGMHRHTYDFQFNYVLSGEIDFVLDGINDKPGDEKLVFSAGDTYFLGDKVLHNETRVSEDFSVLQVYGPANASTEQLTPEIN